MIEFHRVSFSYNTKPILADVNLKIDKGEFIFLVGESGIGKSTLLKMIYFDIFPDAGRVIVDKFNSAKMDKPEVALLRRKLGVVFQDFKLLNDRNIYENVAMPLYINGERKSGVRRKVFDALSRVGLIDRLRDMPYDLSGGEQQRVAIARAIVNDPILLIADEPTGNLDPFVSMEIINLLNDINSRGTAIIIATHNFEVVRRMKNKRIIQVKDRKLFEVRVK